MLTSVLYILSFFIFFFFFQAEDGIRDGHVTGVQTCALPISDAKSVSEKFGWQVYELGAFTKDGEIDLYIGYKGQGLNEIVHNKEYDDIVKFTDYYHEYAAGIRDLKEAVKLSIDLTMELIQ